MSSPKKQTGGTLPPSSIFCAGAMFDYCPATGWRVMAVTTKNHANECKLPGGGSIAGLAESPGDVLYRELLAETGLAVLEWEPASLVSIKRSEHTKHFFAVHSWEPRNVNPKFHDFPDVRSSSFPGIAKAEWRKEPDHHYLWARFMDLPTFYRFCFKDYKEGFVAAVNCYWRHLPADHPGQEALRIILRNLCILH